MKVLQIQMVVHDRNVHTVASTIKDMCDEHLIEGADVVVYNVEQNPELFLDGTVRWDDRTEN
jgi:nitrogen regulatory protein PII